MSLVFSDTSTKQGILQEYEKECGFEYGDVSGSADKLATFVVGVNLAKDDFTRLAITSDGTWQVDSSNQTDYDIISTNLVSGQRDYSFTTDQAGNYILDILKAFVATPSGIFVEQTPVDVSHGTDTDTFTNGQNASGTPVRYDKLANAVFLDPIPNYNYTNGLKLYVNRTSDYFTASDTTKRTGFPPIFDRYFVVKASLADARRNTKTNFAALDNERIGFEGDEAKGLIGSIQRYFSRRAQDEKPRLTPAYQDNH